MKWSNELPKVPGWYLVKRRKTVMRIVDILAIDSESVRASFDFAFEKFVKKDGWQFAGPIPPPEE